MEREGSDEKGKRKGGQKREKDEKKGKGGSLTLPRAPRVIRPALGEYQDVPIILTQRRSRYKVAFLNSRPEIRALKGEAVSPISVRPVKVLTEVFSYLHMQ